jgi:hypothetical protein
VDRRNLEFINLSTHYKRGLALELKSCPGEREKTNQPRNKADEHGDLFYQGSVLKNQVPVEGSQRPGLFQPFPSLKRSLRLSEPSSLISRVT